LVAGFFLEHPPPRYLARPSRWLFRLWPSPRFGRLLPFGLTVTRKFSLCQCDCHFVQGREGGKGRGPSRLRLPMATVTHTRGECHVWRMFWCPNGSPGAMVCCVDVQYEQPVLVRTAVWPMGGGRQLLDAAFSTPDWRRRQEAKKSSRRSQCWTAAATQSASRGSHPHQGEWHESTASWELSPQSPSSLSKIGNSAGGYGTKPTALPRSRPFGLHRHSQPSGSAGRAWHGMAHLFMPGGGWPDGARQRLIRPGRSRPWPGL
jgi:hypothetical protein